MVCVAILSYQRKGKNSDWTGAGMNEDAAVRTDAMLRLLHFLSDRCSVCQRYCVCVCLCVSPSAGLLPNMYAARPREPIDTLSVPDGVAAVSKAEKSRKQNYDTIPSGRIEREGAEASDRRRSSFKESCKE